MKMESPVRICLGAVLVVNLLLLSGITVNGNVIPRNTTSPTTRDERLLRSRPKTPDVSLNELNSKIKPKVSTSAENAKYKDRGRGNVKFNTQVKSSTDSPLRRNKSTEIPKLIIVTPTPEVKKPAEIVDSMRNYKKTKLPNLISSTTPMSVTSDEQSEEEYEDDDEDSDEQNSSEKYSSNFDKFFTIPSFDFRHDSNFAGSDNKKVQHDFRSSSYGGFSSLFPNKVTYGYSEPTHGSFKTEYFNYDTELTTPKNEFFDQKFRQVSQSIIKNLDSLKAKTAPPNVTDISKTIKKDTGLKKLSNNSNPGNKSSVFIKNTKEIRLLDNDGAGSVNKELSDVHGTSIYYEMSVLSTETYAINNSDDDCDEPSAPTPSTSIEEEQASVNAAQSVLPLITSPSPEILSTVSSNYLPISTVESIVDTISPIALSMQNSVFLTSTEKNNVIPSNILRNRSYSKRLNINRNKGSPNSVTSKPVNLSSSYPRQNTRKFYPTTPKNKPVWLVPRRNVTRIRPTVSVPVYSEYFNIKDKTTVRPRLSSPFRPVKTILTTVSSDIDPVLEDDIAGVKKVVQSQSISDNTVPSLSKRGSTKFGTSTASSTEIDTSEIPPTAWALASLRLPPQSPDVVVNGTKSSQKNLDENELQNVGDVLGKKETTSVSTTLTTANSISNDIIPKKTTEVIQNKPWQTNIATTSSTENKTEPQPEIKSDNRSVESNLSAQNSVDESITTGLTTNIEKQTESSWIHVVQEDETSEKNDIKKETMPPVESTKSNGFESITKFPANFTTPVDETVASTELNQTVTENKPNSSTSVDYEITTIRFSYVPSEEVDSTSESEPEPTETIIPSTWHPAFPTRTRITTIQDGPITTYRPKYTAAYTEDETTTVYIDTTSSVELSSHVLENATKVLEEATETPTTTVEVSTETPTTITTIQPVTEVAITQPTTVEVTSDITEISTLTTTQLPLTETVEDTTTMVVEVATEINTEKNQPKPVPTLSTETIETSSKEEETESSEDTSGSNEVITQKTIKSTTSETITESVTTMPGTIRTTTEIQKPLDTTTISTEDVTTQRNAQIHDTTLIDTTTDVEDTTRPVYDDTTSYTGEMTTESSSRVLGDEDTGSGAAVAIAVSTIGVIALVLLIGLLLVVRRRGRRGVYAQRCTPVSLDAYSLDSVSVGHRKGNHRLRASKRSYGNPAYDDEVTSHPMQYAALANFALDVESMTAEFAEIPSVTVRPDEVPPGCEDKNRYSNVLPLPDTRVPLKRLGNDPTTEYINANFVTGPGNIKNYYIACQAPLSNTVVDFWRMIWEQNTRLIVMLTEYMENGVEKCYEYLPPSEISDNKRTFGDYKVILKKREQRDKYAISSVQLINLSTRTWREITHLWYFWPAKGVPDDYDSVIDFLCEMRTYMKISQAAKEYDEEGVEVIYGDQNRSSFSNLSKLRSDESGSGNGINVYSPARAEEQMRRVPPNNGTLGRMKAASEVEGIRPCVVLCASGAGRSAALIALDISARALPGAADVPRVVRHLRAQRPHSLSNRHHYIFVYKVLSEYGNKMLGGGVDTI